MSPHDDAPLRDHAAAYALGALSAEEARTFEAAMARDPKLAAEVTAFREVNALLAQGGVPVHLPPDLKARVLTRVANQKERRLPSPRPPAQSRRLRPWLVAAAIALVALAATLSLDLVRTRAALTTTRDDLARARDSLAAQAQTLATVLGAGEELAVVHLTSTAAAPPGMRLFWNRRTGRAVLHAFGLPPAQGGRVYQLWLIRDGVPVPSQLFNSRPDGEALVANLTLPAGDGVTAAAVTEEPAGGSPQPTSPILLLGTVPAA
ncbi:MAG: anti-sigma factor [Actinomycetota bacterium]|nr:anti-sigma factor [Actinomycetota bacterium]